MMNTLGAAIARRREQRGLMQKDLATAIGRDQGYVSKLERGVIKEFPPPDILRGISEALGMPMTEILEIGGYLTPADDVEGITIPATDPRAALLRAVADATDRDVLKATMLIEVLVDYSKPAQPVIASDAEPIDENRTPRSAPSAG